MIICDCGNTIREDHQKVCDRCWCDEQERIEREGSNEAFDLKLKIEKPWSCNDEEIIDTFEFMQH